MSKIKKYISSNRVDYSRSALSEDQIDSDPMVQFEIWLNEAVQNAIPEPYVMTLASANKNGYPNARIVLLRAFDSKGLIFFTNYESEKAKELEQNPKAALVFYWQEMERQVRIRGNIERASDTESDGYFQTRPRNSQIAAWTSAQSKTLKSREQLDEAFKAEERRFEGKQVDRPPFWGGYRMIPEHFEFWQGRENRLHDRLVYQSIGKNRWSLIRLFP